MSGSRFRYALLALALGGSALLAAASTAGAAVPKLSVSDVSVKESDGVATFKVKLSKAPKKNVTVAYKTVDGTAKAGSDYKSTNGKLSIAKRSKISKPVRVKLIDDSTQESTEKFKLHLSKAKHADIADANGTAKIADDDTPSTVTITYSAPLSWGVISCNGGTAMSSGTCVVPTGSQVILDAAPANSTYQFDHWYGDTCNGNSAGAEMVFGNVAVDHDCQAIFCYVSSPSTCATPSKAAPATIAPVRLRG